MTPQQFSDCIGSIESGQNALAWGDYTDGSPSLPQAMGRFQVHPATLWLWTSRLGKQPTLTDTYDSWSEKVVQGFYIFHQAQKLTDVEIAVAWHLGHVAKPTDSDWNDEDYPTRFTRAAAAQS